MKKEKCGQHYVGIDCAAFAYAFGFDLLLHEGETSRKYKLRSVKVCFLVALSQRARSESPDFFVSLLFCLVYKKYLTR